MYIGAHISIAGSLELCFDRAEKIGCNVFQIFTRNPRSWISKKIDVKTVESFNEKREVSGIKYIFAHMPYLVNFASNQSDIWEKSINSLREEINRSNCLKIPYIVTHIGSIKGGKKKQGLINIVKALEKGLKNCKYDIKILLENTATNIQNLGGNLEDICDIFDKTRYQEKLGLCLDTCHAFATGYDLRKPTILDEIIQMINERIGIENLLLIHCNDSKYDLGTGIDRHEHIGLGKIGQIGFENILGNNKLKNIPLICETPVDERRNDSGNINYLKDLLVKIK